MSSSKAQLRGGVCRSFPPVALLAFSATCSSPDSTDVIAPEARIELEYGLDRSTLDTTVEACDDFYQHVCGGWIASTEVPPDRPFITRADELVAASAEAILHDLLDGEAPAANPEIQRLRAFFGACMRAPGADTHAEQTLAGWTTRIDNINSVADFESVLRDLHSIGVPALFAYSVVPDVSEPTRYRGQIHQGSTGLSHYQLTDTSANGAAARDAYRAHIHRMFVLAGLDDATARREAEQVLDLEIALAGVSMPFQDQFDPDISRHLTSVQALQSSVPRFDWSAYLAYVGHPETRELNVTSPAYLAKLAEILAARAPVELRAYLRWQLLVSLGAALPTRLAEQRAEFTSRRPPRAQMCRVATLEGLGVELSRQFSMRALEPDERDRARAVANRVQSVLVESVSDVTWLSADARQATARKLQETDLKIGYPQQWPATGSFELFEDRFLANVLAARAHEQQRMWRRIDRPRQRAAWEMTVYPNVAHGMAAARLMLVNGFPDVFSNSIILPAASLQPPLFDGQAPPEFSYAVLGSLVGHELAHVLENYEFDEQGAYRSIWTKRDVEAHSERFTCLIDQANAFVVGSTHLDGANTAEENLADLSGLEIAYRALAGELERQLYERGRDGLSPAQRFFYAYAQRWCTVMTEDFERESLRHDWHAPPRFRVNGILSNMPEFAQAFSCSADAGMVRPADQRCSAW